MTGKQRAYLKSLAQQTEVSLIIGKNGCTENVLKQIDQILEKRELVKIKMLDNVSEDQEDMIEKILQSLQAEFVQFIGSKLTIYRRQKSRKLNYPLELVCLEASQSGA